MNFIKKIESRLEPEGIAETLRYVDSCWDKTTGHYDIHKLTYNRSRMGNLAHILLKEQKHYCCYCMRKLYLHDTRDGHQANVTLEHIIPNKIKDTVWDRDRKRYRSFPPLDKEHVTVYIGGDFPREAQWYRMLRPPFPHFVSYHNLVASCNGSIFEMDTLKTCHCCNNSRGTRYVKPVFLDEQLSSGIGYAPDGSLDYDVTVYNPQWFDQKHLNLECQWLRNVRHFWYLLSQSDYTAEEVDKARSDLTLREDIIDDLDPGDHELRWLPPHNDTVWNLISEYSWFYHYYHSGPILRDSN